MASFYGGGHGDYLQAVVADVGQAYDSNQDQVAPTYCPQGTVPRAGMVEEDVPNIFTTGRLEEVRRVHGDKLLQVTKAEQAPKQQQLSHEEFASRKVHDDEEDCTSGHVPCQEQASLESPLSRTVGKSQSPASKAVMALAGKRAMSLQTDLAAGIPMDKAIEWREGTLSSPAVVKRHGRTLARLSNSLADQNKSDGAAIIDNMLARSDMKPVADGVSAKHAKETAAGAIIVNGIRKFLQHCTTTNGSRTKEVQDAVDAVLVASFFEDDNKRGKVKDHDVLAALGLDKARCAKIPKETVAKLKSTDEYIYKTRKRKVRSDDMGDLARSCVLEWCHTAGARHYSNGRTIHKVTLANGLEEEHPQRVWEDYKWESRYKRFKESDVWESHSTQHPELTIGLTKMKEHCCKCCVRAKPQSCVDILSSGGEEYLTALRRLLATTAVKKQIERCTCPVHASHSTEDDNGDEGEPMVPLEDLVKSVHSFKDFVNRICCPAVTEPSLKYRADRNAPRRVPIKCVNGECQECGVPKLRIDTCPVYTKCLASTVVNEWKYAPRPGGGSQLELTKSKVPVPLRDLIPKFVDQLVLCRKHFNDASWLNLMRKIDLETLGAGSAFVATDFSATVDLRAKWTDNCSVDNHAVLAVYYTIENRREVLIADKDGHMVKRVLYDTRVFYFFGSSHSKGKKNDHVFHNACLDYIVEYLKRLRKRDKKEELTHLIVWTDNCAAQYKCRHNFRKVERSKQRLDVTIDHRFAQIYHFKGCWDSAGKVIKEEIFKLELDDDRFPIAWDCYENLHNTKMGKKYRQTKHPSEESAWTANERIVGYATEKLDEYNEKRNQYHHIVYTDRSGENVETMDAIPGTHELHQVATNNEDGTLIIADKPCSCIPCRNKTEGCAFVSMRNQRVFTIADAANEPPSDRQLAALAFEQNLLPKLRELFSSDLGDQQRNVTTAILADLCRKNGLPVSGRKAEVAARLISYAEGKLLAAAVISAGGLQDTPVDELIASSDE